MSRRCVRRGAGAVPGRPRHPLRPLCQAVLLIAVALGGCDPTPPQPPPAITLTAVQNGERIDTRVGQSVIVRLPANRGTGYGWDVAPNSTPDLALSSRAYVDADDGGAGVGGADLFVFTVRMRGQGNLVLVYRRAWRKREPAVRRFVVTVVTHTG